ncbi:hypothetical protein [Nocardioides luteus]|uniref:hypothetical protein n=1 Tax=Nocardioides luteus TaxID=1844 RepID=UPI00115FBF5B|nr:hypothetical protein [Nocardioides luteus]
MYVPVTDRFGCQPSGSPAEARVGKPPEEAAEVVAAPVGELGEPGEVGEVDGAAGVLAGALGAALVEGLGLRVRGALGGDGRWRRPGGRWPGTAGAAWSGRRLTVFG